MLEPLIHADISIMVYETCLLIDGEKAKDQFRDQVSQIEDYIWKLESAINARKLYLNDQKNTAKKRSFSL